MSPFITTAMSLRAGTELLEAGCYALLFRKTNHEKLRIKVAGPTLVAGATIVAIADIFLVAMRLLGRTPNPRVELSLLPIRLLMFWATRSLIFDNAITRTALSQNAIVLQKGAQAIGNSMGQPETGAFISAVLTVGELGLRTFNLIDLVGSVKRAI